MKLLYERCPRCFQEERLPYFVFEVRADEEAFESLQLQCLKCKRQLRCLGNKDEI